MVTGTNLFARSMGSALGIAVFGAIANAALSQRLGGHASATAAEHPGRPPSTRRCTRCSSPGGGRRAAGRGRLMPRRPSGARNRLRAAESATTLAEAMSGRPLASARRVRVASPRGADRDPGAVACYDRARSPACSAGADRADRHAQTSRDLARRPRQQSRTYRWSARRSGPPARAGRRPSGSPCTPYAGSPGRRSWTGRSPHCSAAGLTTGIRVPPSLTSGCPGSARTRSTSSCSMPPQTGPPPLTRTGPGCRMPVHPVTAGAAGLRSGETTLLQVGFHPARDAAHGRRRHRHRAASSAGSRSPRPGRCRWPASPTDLRRGRRRGERRSPVSGPSLPAAAASGSRSGSTRSGPQHLHLRAWTITVARRVARAGGGGRATVRRRPPPRSAYNLIAASGPQLQIARTAPLDRGWSGPSSTVGARWSACAPTCGPGRQRAAPGHEVTVVTNLPPLPRGTSSVDVVFPGVGTLPESGRRRAGRGRSGAGRAVRSRALDLPAERPPAGWSAAAWPTPVPARAHSVDFRATVDDRALRRVERLARASAANSPTSGTTSAIESTTRVGRYGKRSTSLGPGRAGQHQDRPQPGLDARRSRRCPSGRRPSRWSRSARRSRSAPSASSAGWACRRSTARPRWPG